MAFVVESEHVGSFDGVVVFGGRVRLVSVVFLVLGSREILFDFVADVFGSVDRSVLGPVGCGEVFFVDGGIGVYVIEVYLERYVDLVLQRALAQEVGVAAGRQAVVLVVGLGEVRLVDRVLGFGGSLGVPVVVGLGRTCTVYERVIRLGVFAAGGEVATFFLVVHDAPDHFLEHFSAHPLYVSRVELYAHFFLELLSLALAQPHHPVQRRRRAQVVRTLRD